MSFRGQVKIQSDSDSYNGAVRENYSWSQDYSDVEVRVFVPKTVNKGRQVNTHTRYWSPDMTETLRLCLTLKSCRLSSGQCQSAGQQHQSVCEGWSGGEDTDGGRVHSQDQH